MPGALSPDQIAAAAAVVAAGGSVAIPLVLAWMAAAQKRRDDRKAEVFAMRDFSAQWQDYNLAIATSPEAAAHLHDTGFYWPGPDGAVELTVPEKRSLHFIFFELTAMYQCYYAVKRGVEEQGWAATIVRDIAPTIENERLLDLALTSRGYSEEFADYVRLARHGGMLPAIPKDAGRTWRSYPAPWIIIAIATMASLMTIVGVWLSLDRDRDGVNDVRCAALQREMVAARPRRPDAATVFQALDCRPTGTDPQIFVPPTDRERRAGKPLPGGGYPPPG